MYISNHLFFYVFHYKIEPDIFMFRKEKFSICSFIFLYFVATNINLYHTSNIYLYQNPYPLSSPLRFLFVFVLFNPLPLIFMCCFFFVSCLLVLISRYSLYFFACLCFSNIGCCISNCIFTCF